MLRLRRAPAACVRSRLVCATTAQGYYEFLDVRSKTEFEYKITGSINVPIINAVCVSAARAGGRRGNARQCAAPLTRAARM